MKPVLFALLLLAGCVPATGGGGQAASASAAEVTALHTRQGIALLAARDFKAAKAELTKAQPFRSGDPKALMALAIASDMTGDFRTSDRAYAELMSREPDQAMLFNNLGYSYMLRGDLPKAAAYLAEAERRQPGQPVIRNNLSMLQKAAPL